MKRNLIQSSTLALLMIWAGVSAVAKDPPSGQRPTPYPVTPPRAYQNAEVNGTRTEQGTPGKGYWSNTASYKIKARLLPDLKKLEGSASISYKNNSPDTLKLLYFSLPLNVHKDNAVRSIPTEATGGVTVKSLSVGGARALTAMSARPRYFVNGTVVMVVPASPVVPGGTASLGVEWEFTIPQAGAGGRMGYDTDSLFYLAYWYPQMNVYDDVVGWQNDQFRGLGEFYSGFADYELSLEVPSGWIVQSTGTLRNPDKVFSSSVRQRLALAAKSDTAVRILNPSEYPSATQAGTEGWIVWQYSATNVRDVAWLATRHSIWEAARASVGDLNRDGRKDYTLVHSFWRPSALKWAQSIKYMQHSITFHSAFTGIPYPWPHMTAIEAAGIIGGGMEYPMMTLAGAVNMGSDATLYEIISHEIAHMWVPMIVSTDERRYGWLDEGYTAFHTYQAMKDFNPEWENASPFYQAYLGFARAGGEEEIYRRMDYYYSLGHLASLMYGKPAWGLALLRNLMGEETFMKAHRGFLSSWAWKNPYPWDMFRSYNAASGGELEWFFRMWYYDNWMVDQAVGDVTTSEKGTVVRIDDQGLMPMPAVVTVTYDDQSTATATVPVSEWLTGKRSAEVILPGARSVVRVEIDAEQAYPDVDRTNNSWDRP